VTYSLCLGLALVVTAPRLKDPRPEVPPIEGDWELVEWIQFGAQSAFPAGSGVEFRPDGKRLWRDGPGRRPDERGYKLYPKTTPAAIDLIRPADGSPPDVFPSIYKVDGDTLVLCIGNPGAERPTRFEAGPGSSTMLMTFKRVGKK
jgi:uncharacterized protein (TIGR03067 family)